MIDLPYGNAQFALIDLINRINNSPINYITMGGQNTSLDNHSKPNSLDFWLRDNYVADYRRNIRQTCIQLTNTLVATGHFEVDRLPCVDTGRMCVALRLIER